METLSATPSKAALWTGRIIRYILIAFFLMDSTMKIIREQHNIDGTIQLGWPDSWVVGIGLILLPCVILYIFPRTAFIGAILLTGYLGGAIATHLRIGGNVIFTVVFGILVWVGLGLTNPKLKTLLK